MLNGKPLILAVDDEENIRNLITYTFEPYSYLKNLKEAAFTAQG